MKTFAKQLTENLAYPFKKAIVRLHRAAKILLLDLYKMYLIHRLKKPN